MAGHRPADANFRTRVRESFARQRIMQTIGARLASVAPGKVTVELPFDEKLTQQHGFLHAAVVAAIADSACGYAALTLAPAHTAVLTIEYKINLLSPASGKKFLARGHVIRSGRTITVSIGEVVAHNRGTQEKLIATMVSTIMIMAERDDLKD